MVSYLISVVFYINSNIHVIGVKHGKQKEKLRPRKRKFCGNHFSQMN